jgi:hypothetical protein
MGVASTTMILDENRDNEARVEKYLNEAADLIHKVKLNGKGGVAMVHAPEGGAFIKGGQATNDSRRGEGFAAALCAAYYIKYAAKTTDSALEMIRFVFIILHWARVLHESCMSHARVLYEYCTSIPESCTSLQES